MYRNNPAILPINLSSLGTSLKLLFSGYLIVIAIGYAMSMIQVLYTHGMADGELGLSVEDVVYSYYGDRSGSMLETKLNGSMKMNAPDNERFNIIQWVRDGGEEAQYGKIKNIIETRCTICHNEHAAGIPDFTQFEVLKKYSESDHGATFSSLIRVSHIHLFGIAFIFMFVGMIFSLASGVPIIYKGTAIIMPYAFLIMDIASWWLTKLNPHFAWLVILGGMGLAVAFMFMWSVSMYEMWILPRRQTDFRIGIQDE